MINFLEAREEATRLSKMLKREVEVKAFDCDCDYSRNCGVCAGQGTHYELVYRSCDHLVNDDNDDECDQNFCREREQVQSETFPALGSELKSLAHCESEVEEAIA